MVILVDYIMCDRYHDIGRNTSDLNSVYENLKLEISTCTVNMHMTAPNLIMHD